MTDEEVKELSGKLMSTCNRLDEAFDEASDALASLNLGVRSAVPIPGTDAVLVFAKREKVWQLLVGTSKADLVPIKECPRQVRVMAVQALDDLRNQLISDAETMLSDMLDGIKKVRAFVAQFREEP